MRPERVCVHAPGQTLAFCTLEQLSLHADMMVYVPSWDHACTHLKCCRLKYLQLENALLDGAADDKAGDMDGLVLPQAMNAILSL